MTPPLAISFDVTGTLIHCPRLGEIYAEVLSRHGVETTPQRIADAFRTVWQEFACRARPDRDRFAAHPEGARGFWREVVERLCLLLEVEAPSRFASAELYDRFAHADAWELYPEVAEALAELQRRGVRLAVVSNWDERLRQLLADLGVADRFETIVISQEIGVAKPHPAIFGAAAQRLGIGPESILHVGDGKIEDVEGARAAGMQALHLDRSGAGGDVHDLRDLSARIEPPAQPLLTT